MIPSKCPLRANACLQTPRALSGCSTQTAAKSSSPHDASRDPSEGLQGKITAGSASARVWKLTSGIGISTGMAMSGGSRSLEGEVKDPHAVDASEARETPLNRSKTTTQHQDSQRHDSCRACGFRLRVMDCVEQRRLRIWDSECFTALPSAAASKV